MRESQKIRSDFPGVYFMKHSQRKHGVQADKYFLIRFKIGNKSYEEGIGWTSQGHSAREASGILSTLKENRKQGKGPVTYREMRKEQEAKETAKKAEQRAEEKRRAEEELKAIPFADVWAKYLDQCKADGKKSCERERSLYIHWIKSVIGSRPLAEIAPIHLEKIKSNMTKSNAAPRSIHYALAVIRQVFNYASRHDLFTGDNPVGKVKKPVADNRRVRFLTKQEAEDILRELESTPNSRRITLLSLHCGLRFGEIAGLTWGDVDLSGGRLCIRNPKNGRTRFAYMTEAVKAELLEMEPGGKSDMIFPDRKGNRRHQMSDAFNDAIDRLGLNAGIDDPRQKVCFHTCRHSFASWLVEGGTGLFTVKELLGHKSLSMTERYSHLQPETLQKAVSELDRQLKKDRTVIELADRQNA